MKRLYSRRYELTPRGVEISREVWDFVQELLRVNTDVDPIDIYHIVHTEFDLAMAKRHLDVTEKLKGG